MRLEQRRIAIVQELEKQAAEGHRPVNALEARTELLMLRLFGADDDEVGRVLDGLADCLDRSRVRGTYPVLQVVNRLKVFQQHLGEHPRFGPLFEKMRAVVRERSGETSEGRLLCQRGGQLLADGKHAEALKYLGQGRLRLFKDETMRSAVRASLGCSHAYASMGHLWAARMEAMIAAHFALCKDEGELFCPQEVFWAVATLARIELCLGRVTAFLAGFENAFFLRRYQATRHRGVKRLERELARLEVLLAVRFLGAGIAAVGPFEAVVGTLSRLPLDMARWALLHRLGRTDDAFAEFPKDLADTPDKMAAYFDSLVRMSDHAGLPPLADPRSSFMQMSSTLLGVDYRIRARNEYAVILLAENLLAVLEAALASARWENLALIHDRFELTLDVADGGKNPPEIGFERPHGPDGYRLVFGPGLLDWMNRWPRDEVTQFFNLFLFSVLLTTTIAPYDDLKAEFDAWHGEEVFSRALSFSPLSIMADDLIGRKGYALDRWGEAADAPAV